MGIAAPGGRAGYPYRLTDDWTRATARSGSATSSSAAAACSVADMARLQLDTRSPVAPVLVPYLLDVDCRTATTAPGQRLLRGWDFRQPADSGAAAYFNWCGATCWPAPSTTTCPRDLWPDGGDRWMAVMDAAAADPTATWWDDAGTDDVVETRDDILAAAMIDARDELTRRLGLDPDDWNWGHLHQLELRSSTLAESGLGPGARGCSTAPAGSLGGGDATVDATSWDAAAGYGVITAPSMRMVVSLGDLDRSRWINLTGVSGHPAAATTPTRRTCGRAARRCRGPSPRAPSTAAGRTR